MVFGLNAFIPDRPKMFSKKRDLDVGKFILKDMDVINYLSEDEV